MRRFRKSYLLHIHQAWARHVVFKLRKKNIVYSVTSQPNLSVNGVMMTLFHWDRSGQMGDFWFLARSCMTFHQVISVPPDQSVTKVEFPFVPSRMKKQFLKKVLWVTTLVSCHWSLQTVAAFFRFIDQPCYLYVLPSFQLNEIDNNFTGTPLWKKASP